MTGAEHNLAKINETAHTAYILRRSLAERLQQIGRTGYRYYTADQVKELDAILALREMNLSLAEIQKLLQSDMTIEQYMEILVHKKNMWQEKIQQSQDRIDAIDEVIEKLVASKPPVKLHGRNILIEALWL